jgi:4-hydroxy-tetrahydrodipicolinate reductase
MRGATDKDVPEVPTMLCAVRMVKQDRREGGMAEIGGAKIGIGIAGCAGRMGRTLIGEIVAASDLRLAGGTVEPGVLGIVDRAALFALAHGEFPVTDDPDTLFRSADVVIDFTSPAAARRHAALAGRIGTALVVGTTGLAPEDDAAIAVAAGTAPIVRAANMSLGVNLLIGLAERVAAALGPDFDIEIVEMHHRHKRDAPSGTALALGHAAARGRNATLDAVAQRGRDGDTGPRPAGAIGFAALRGGDVVGDHTIVFAGPGERIELTHKATDRQIFARGAVAAARWAARRPPGLYSMADVLGL